MADRLYMKDNPPRLITSMPGYNSSPSLDDQYKTFDSDWFFGGGIKFKLTFSLTDTGASFPYALSYIPAIISYEIYSYAVMVTGGGFWSTVPPSFGWPSPPTNALGINCLGGYGVSNTGIFGYSVSPGLGSSYRLALVMEG